MSAKNFIVPHDFTTAANVALDHAIATAGPLGADVYVLHVVSKEKDIKDAENKLTALINEYRTDVSLIPSVRVGNIFDDIGNFAAEHHSELIFMGTHGASRWQKIKGSDALKVITNSPWRRNSCLGRALKMLQNF